MTDDDHLQDLLRSAFHTDRRSGTLTRSVAIGRESDQRASEMVMAGHQLGRGHRNPADDVSRVAAPARVSPVTEDIMQPHPYVRAYMAGIVVPTLFLLVIMTISAYHRYYFEVPNQFVIPLSGRPLDRAIIFPMAVVPNVWGLWNVLYLALRHRVRMPLGVHGALLPLVLMPGGVALTRALDVFTIQWRFALPMVPIAMATYYLAWKYFVGFLNEEVGIA
jgi:hypothetical protein